MYLKQHYVGCLARTSYLIGDESTGCAVVVDPHRDVNVYLEDARQQGLRIFAVLLTRLPRDGSSGHDELRQRLGAEVYVGAGVSIEPGLTPLQNGDGMEFGQLRLRALATPGRTLEALSILVYDLAWDETEPYAVLTGETLLIGDIGQPELVSDEGVPADELAGLLHDSLHGKLLHLPESTLVYPGLSGGTTCHLHLLTDMVSTIGTQRRSNWALQPVPRDEFVARLTGELPENPELFHRSALLARRKGSGLEPLIERALQPLSFEQVLEMRKAGAQVLDVRSSADFGSAHLRGSVNVGLGGRLATWAEQMLGGDGPVVLVADRGRELDAVLRLGKGVLERVAGYLESGMLAVEGRPGQLAWIERVTVHGLVRQLDAARPPVVLDVRSEREWAENHVDGSLNIPLNELPSRLGELQRGRPVVVICRSGYRSSLAASLLKRAGWDSVADLIGGLNAWNALAELTGSRSAARVEHTAVERAAA